MELQDWGNVEIRVSTAVLKQKAAEVSRRIDTVTSLFSELESVVRNTRYYWVGAAGDAHRQDYAEKKISIEEMLRRLREHPVDLLKISGNYEDTERKIESNIGFLSENAID